MRRLLLALLLFLSAPGVLGSAPDPSIILSLSPQVGYAPLTVYARMTVEPNYLTRGICLMWDSETFSGASCWQVDGQYAPRIHYYEIKALPTGEYAVQAELLTTVGRTVTPLQTVHVTEGLPR